MLCWMLWFHICSFSQLFLAYLLLLEPFIPPPPTRPPPHPCLQLSIAFRFSQHLHVLLKWTLSGLFNYAFQVFELHNLLLSIRNIASCVPHKYNKIFGNSMLLKCIKMCINLSKVRIHNHTHRQHNTTHTDPHWNTIRINSIRTIICLYGLKSKYYM